MRKITPELEKRIDKAFRSFHHDDCNGRGIRGQSPFNPGGDMCEGCGGTGFNPECMLSDLESYVKSTINEYINGFLPEETHDDSTKNN